MTGGPKRRVVDTSSGRSDGLERCPKCGSTDVVHRIDSSMLMCTFCRNEWNETSLEAKFGFDSPIDQLRGTLLGSGASNTPESSEAVVTLKCGACGAEVVVNTAEALQSRCHWCRNTLSINQQLPNGAVPDGVLPFSITRDEAIKRIEEFVKARKFFAHPTFVKEFAASEVVGVYLPYLTVDANASVELEGQGEVLIRTRTVSTGSGNNQSSKTVYDADLYQLGRAFDILVDDIQLESSQQRADQDTSRNTNNIINAILPFDVKHAVTYNANYLRGYTSERRDMDVRQLMRAADEQTLSIARARANESTRQYNRGVRWERESIAVHGTRWLALYVPVWLYSYYQERKDGPGLLHYVAVNGRTGETMGSVPVRQGRLIGISTLIGGVITAASVAVVIGAAIGGFLW
ncbi:TFIIB-type zinc ribbon-containing protein [Pseudoclavibacter endophyticus]|uniref:TFIIB-type zinc ribbon-containing protein n=1 Tax=Pseudoclavibacter endophyticus TaxID=1778590 RepID=A0A6H9WVB4_9MICO|nr:TFIIB-type zinc ribbon-containing protein [Pseudoclavibacter endophyticus]